MFYSLYGRAAGESSGALNLICRVSGQSGGRLKMRPLEDGLGDIVSKARQGLKLTETALADAAGLSSGQGTAVESGQLVPDEAAVLHLAGALGLRGEALAAIARDEYRPDPVNLEVWGCVHALESSYSGYPVNAYLVWDSQTRRAILFDTGTDIQAIRRLVHEHNLTLDTVALTHTHRDHIAILGDIRNEFKPRIIASRKEPAPGAHFVADGEQIALGSLSIDVRETGGHSPGGLTFVVTGFEGAPPVAAVGDALFAGSAGGARVSYERLLENIRSRILTLPDATLILPGHGPMTTVGEEKANNPFAG